MGRAGYKERKEHALKLLELNPELTASELVEATGMPKSTAGTIKRSFHAAREEQPEVRGPQDFTEAVSLGFQPAPEPISDEPVKKSLPEQGMEKFRDLMGLPKKSEEKPPKEKAVAPVELTRRQKRFVESFGPAFTLGFISLSAWSWSRIGPEYSILAPTDDVASHIMMPITRIVARSFPVVEQLSPNAIDLAAAGTALIGYVHTSLQLYNKMKAEKQIYEEPGGNGYREYRTAETENRAADTSNGRYDLFEQAHGNVQADVSNARYFRDFNAESLTEKERKQYEALARLRDIDLASRARRSGNVRRVSTQVS